MTPQAFDRIQRRALLLFAAASSLASCRSERLSTMSDSTPAVAPASGLARRSADAETRRCTMVGNGVMELSGRLVQEHRAGPPGYGETPDRDEKISVFLLQLTDSLSICGDSVDGESHPALRVTKVQLTGRIDPKQLTHYLGHTLMLYGTLNRQTRGTDFTPIVMRVDSIPGLRSAPSASVLLNLSN